MEFFIKEFFDFLGKVAPYIASLLAVWLGWRLGWKSQAKQRLLDHLMQKFNALRLIKEATEYIPVDLNKYELYHKLRTEEKFRSNLITRVERLFGLRNELIPYLDSEFINIIDNQLRSLFKFETGSHIFRDGEYELSKFADFALQMITLIDLLEKKLTKEYEEYLK